MLKFLERVIQKRPRLLATDASILFLLLFLAFFTRLLFLQNNPLGFHKDELMNGYVGRFILDNGVDLYGNAYPLLYFDNFGDFPNVVPMYISGLFTYIFGINQFAVRFPIAVLGSLSVGIFYLILRQIFQKKAVAFLGSLVLVFLPSHVMLSRSTSEGVIALFLFLLGLLIFNFGKIKSSNVLFLISFLIWMATYLVYPGYRVLIPLVWCVIVVYQAFSKRKIAYLFLTFFILSSVVTASIASTEWGRGRFEQTSIIHSEKITSNQWGYISSLGPDKVLESKLFLNKELLLLREFLVQYFSYFSADYLIGYSALPDRYKIPLNGVISVSTVLLLISGMTISFYRLNRKNEFDRFSKYGRELFGILLLILFVAPIPAALTLDDSPNIHRSLQFVVLFVVLSTYFLHELLFSFGEKIHKLLLVCITIFIFAEGIFLIFSLTNLQAKTYFLNRDEEQQLLAEFLVNEVAENEKVFVSGKKSSALYYLFFSKNFDASLTNKVQHGLKIESLNSIVFIDSDCINKHIPQYIDEFTGNILLIERTACGEILPEKYQAGSLSFSAGADVFTLYTIDSKLFNTEMISSYSQIK